MKLRISITKQKTSLCLLVAIALMLSSGRLKTQAQSSDPQREQLLNGLHILLLSRPGDQNVLLKLRIHSGSAFDIAGKSGTMSLLGDILFPDPLTYEYFKEDINGRLIVKTDYDSIEVTMVGRASEYDRIVDTLRGALLNTALTPENLNKVREAKIKTLSDHKLSNAEIADRIVRERLFGTFPYSKDPRGSVESLSRIDRADLMLARDRFLVPNNATLVIIGGVDEKKAMRALRQLLGAWRKSEELAPASFRQPGPADARTLIANYPGSEKVELRLAVRGLARGDRDYPAATILGYVAKQRWQRLLGASAIFAKHDAHTLPGIFLLGASVENQDASKALEAARSVVKSLTDSAATAAEIDQAKAEYLTSMNLSADDRLANEWLDAESYSLPPQAEQTRSLNAIQAADLQRVAARLFNSAVASVVVGNAETLKGQLAAGTFEVMGEATAKAPETATAPPPAQPVKHRTFDFKPKNASPLIKNQKPTTPPD